MAQAIDEEFLKRQYIAELYASQELIRILEASVYNTRVRTTNSFYQASNRRNGQSANLGTPTSSNASSSQNSEVPTVVDMPMNEPQPQPQQEGDH